MPTGNDSPADPRKKAALGQPFSYRHRWGEYS